MPPSQEEGDNLSVNAVVEEIPLALDAQGVYRVGGTRVTRYNALFHWQVPPGREMDAGREVGRHFIVTHAYWREGGPEFGNVNIMAVVHGTK